MFKVRQALFHLLIFLLLIGNLNTSFSRLEFWRDQFVEIETLKSVFVPICRLPPGNPS